MGATRKLTRPGIGDQKSGAQPRVAPTPPPTSGIVCPPPARAERKSSESIAFRPTEPPPAIASSAAVKAPEEAAKRTGKRQRQSIREDDVGEAAARFGAPTSSSVRPRLVRSRKELAGAPIDHRDAFVMSLVDGQMSVAMLVDVAGMPEEELVAILTRLRRLGIISYG